MCGEVIMELSGCKGLTVVASQVLRIAMNLEHHFQSINHIGCICDFHVGNFGPPGVVVDYSKQVVTFRDAQQVNCKVSPGLVWQWRAL